MATKQQLENRKIAAAGGQPIDKPTSTAALTDEATKRLLGSDIVSSEDTGLEEKFAEAKAGIKTGQEAGAKRIENVFGRKISDVEESGARKITSVQEAQRGFATNNALLRQLKQDTEKSVRDLEERKEGLLLAGEASAATAITNLQIQELQFEQKAKQQTFANMMSLAGLDLQKEAGKRAERAFGLQERGMDFAETQAKSAVALEFGIAVEEGDTFQDIINRAKPFASAKRQKEMDLAAAQLENIQAQTQKLESEAKIDDIDIDSAAAIALLDPTFLARIQDPNVAIKVSNRMVELQQINLKSLVLEDLRNGVSRQYSIERMFKNQNVLDKVGVTKMINDLYRKYSPQTAQGAQTTLQKDLETVGGGILKKGQDIFRYMTGSEAKGTDLLKFFIGTPSLIPLK